MYKISFDGLDAQSPLSQLLMVVGSATIRLDAAIHAKQMRITASGADEVELAESCRQLAQVPGSGQAADATPIKWPSDHAEIARALEPLGAAVDTLWNQATYETRPEYLNHKILPQIDDLRDRFYEFLDLAIEVMNRELHCLSVKSKVPDFNTAAFRVVVRVQDILLLAPKSKAPAVINMAISEYDESEDEWEVVNGGESLYEAVQRVADSDESTSATDFTANRNTDALNGSSGKKSPGRPPEKKPHLNAVRDAVEKDDNRDVGEIAKEVQADLENQGIRPGHRHFASDRAIKQAIRDEQNRRKNGRQ